MEYVSAVTQLFVIVETNWSYTSVVKAVVITYPRDAEAAADSDWVWTGFAIAEFFSVAKANRKEILRGQVTGKTVVLYKL